jgi:zinc transport system substrate-binding protein
LRTILVRIANIFLLIISVHLFCMGNLEASQKTSVFTGILPIRYLVERVGGDLVECGVLVGPGQEPHTFEPTPQTVTKLSTARAFFITGFPFEEALAAKMSRVVKGIEIVDLRQGIQMRPMENDRDHDHGRLHTNQRHKDEDHSSTLQKNSPINPGSEQSQSKGSASIHRDMDPHIWLDPQLAKVQARTIADTLIKLDPTNADQYSNHLLQLEKDIDLVDEKLASALSSLKGKEFFVYHPAYGYFADRYGLKQTAVQMAGKEPTARQLVELLRRAKHLGVKVIFVQPQFSQKTARTLAEEIGGVVIPMDDLSPNYIENLSDMANKIQKALDGRNSQN